MHFVNAFKHSAPWVGLPNQHPFTEVMGVLDSNRVGVVHGVCVSVYKQLTAMISNLGKPIAKCICVFQMCSLVDLDLCDTGYARPIVI